MKRVLVPYRNPNKLTPYLDALRAAELDPVAHFVDSAGSLDGIAGLTLIGGTDINPSRYGQPRMPETEDPDDERDSIELELIDQAIQDNLPIFAICRGLQIVNVYHGGTLVQHIDSGRHCPHFEDRAKPAHEVEIEPDSVLANWVAEPKLHVNSRHHQAADRIGAGLRVTARDPHDGIVEGLERQNGAMIVAVQWHPEDQAPTQPEQLRLFQQFAKAI
ncbi:MAG: gamma-glutamyl-gamma-aminobutyrate hydrolase family protein [Acidobacteriaceae bacterium]|nr:gamma-glutamyl-gamma-aminobutyrate hydrolase family protein [Acidobacteriaceae bacterium]